MKFKKVFWQQNVDAVHGDYLEFEVAHDEVLDAGGVEGSFERLRHHPWAA